MSTAEYVLQITPKNIEFKNPTIYTKVSSALFFGELQYRSQYARFIRSQQGSFYGERLKLINLLKQEATFQLIGIDKLGSQTQILKLQLEMMQAAQSDNPIKKSLQNQEIKFQYEIQVYEKEISDQDYQQIESKGSQRESDPMILKMLSTDFESKVESTNILDIKQKEEELPETPRLKQQDDQKIIEQFKLDHSPIQTKQYPEIQVQQLPPQNIRRSSLKAQSSILLSPNSVKSNTPSKQNSQIHGSRVRFTEPPKQPKPPKYSIILLVFYAFISVISVYTGSYVKTILK